MNTERRFSNQSAAKPRIEKRDDKTSMLVGYSAVFYNSADPGTQYDMGYGIVERIAPTAFNRAIAEKQDVVARFDHDEVLGRSTSGTLRLSVDSTGLKYEIDIPDTVCGRDVATLIDRGDITGSSFAFRATKIQWSSAEDDSDDEIRLIQDCDLMDVGPVTFPAYLATTTGVRSADADNVATIVKERDEWRSAKNHDADDVETRLALVKLDD